MRLCLSIVMVLFLHATPAAGDRVVLVAGGDTAYPSGWFNKKARKRGAQMYSKIKPLLQSADLRFLNLESPITLKKAVAKKTYPLTTRPVFLKLLVEAGFNMFSLANNHTGDAGKPGLADTFEHLKSLSTASNPIFWSGAGFSVKERQEPAFFSVPGKKSKVAFLAFRLGGSPLANPMSGAERQIRQAAKKADWVVVSAHGGAEYKYVPGHWKAKRFRKFIDAGAAVVLGHGPHCPQGVERYKGGVIYYSLGNFSFGTRPRQHRTGGMLLRAFMARVTIENGRLAQAEAIPLFVDNRKEWTVSGVTMPVRLFTPAPVKGAHKKQMFDELKEWNQGIRGNQTAITQCKDSYCIRRSQP